MVQHIVKYDPGFALKVDVRMIERRVIYQVWWSNSCILSTNNETQARRKAKEVHGQVHVVIRDR